MYILLYLVLWKVRHPEILSLLNSSAFFLGSEKFFLALYSGGVYGFSCTKKINKE